MEISIIEKDKVTLTELPEKVRGRYPVNVNRGNKNVPLFYVEEENDQWLIMPESNVYYKELADSGSNYQRQRPLVNGSFLEAKNITDGSLYYITAEDKRSEDVFFKKYKVPADGIIRIGRKADNDISFENRFMDNYHAEIRYDKNGKIYFREIGVNNQTKNGSFINSKKVVSTELHYGDVFYFMGLKIVIAKDYIAVNNPKRSVKLKLNPVDEKNMPMMNVVGSETEHEFSQSPRIYQKVENEKIKLSSPPTEREERSTPWLLMYGPSIAMGLASIVSSFYSVYSIMQSDGNIMAAMPMVIFAVAMLFGMILCPLLAREWEKKNNINRRAVQEREYINELMDAEKKLQNLKKEQREIILNNNPPLSVLEDRILKSDVNLWERNIRHEDFLELPFGRGNTDLKVDIEAPTIPKETIQQIKVTLNRFLGQNRKIDDVPVTLSLYEHPFLGVVGKREDVLDVAKAAILEMVSLHSYDELKLCFIYDEDEKKEWEFAKWLPHAWSNDLSENYIAENLDQVKLLSNSLANVIEMREKLDDSALADEVPHFVIIAADRTLAEKAMALKKLYANHKNVRFSVIALYNEKKYLPRSFDTYLAIDGQLGNIVNLNKIEDSVRINNVIKYQKPLDDIAIKLANTKLDVVSAENSLPENVTLFEMLKIKQPENFDSLTKWAENDATKSLAVPIGVDEDGYSIMLDIHEKAHGPHGLIAGMTGSGKSEFIISYIASLAMNFDPDDVSFILVDFKGGGMGDTFKNLPHVVGSVTNLDGNELNRSLVAIESELVRRQKLLKEASEKYGISNIDIYRYQAIRNDLKAQSRGHELEPFPHLIIIVDEFAELKQQNEEFLNQLIRIARIGRSLGVHLILATQKPDGVVNDQITSNIRFKVCLKVQSSGDSQSVIGGPEAAMLTKTGEFYLQVGYNELFELGQAAWAGAPYIKVEEEEHVSKSPVRLFDNSNNELAILDSSVLRDKNSASTKQVDELIDYLDEISASTDFEPKKLWIPPLEAPEIAQQRESEDRLDFMITPVVGLYDDVSEQSYKPLEVDFFNRGNAIIYGAPGSGNIEFLNRLIYEGIKNHDSSEIEFDLLDFDSGSLIAFEDAPQVKNIILPHEKERVDAFFDNIKDELNRRKERFVPYGGNYKSYVSVTGEKVPIIVVVLDNYTNFINTYIDGADNIEQLAREGTNYGIFFVVTASNSNSISYRMVPNFGQIYVLQQNNDDEYFNILGRHDHMKPSPYIGRGIFKKNDKTYEFQVDILFNNRVNRFEAIREFCRDLAVASGKKVTKPEVVIPKPKVDEKNYSLEKFNERVSRGPKEGWPVGWNEDEILYQYNTGGVLPIIFDQDSSDTKIRFVLNQVINNEPNLTVIDYRGKDKEEKTEFYDNFVEDFIELLQERNRIALEAKKSGKPIPKFSERSFLIPNYWEFLTSLSFEQNYRWKEIVEYVEPVLGLNLIVGTDNNHSASILDSIYGGIEAHNAIWCGKDFSSQKWYHTVDGKDLTHDSIVVQMKDNYILGRLPDMAA